MNYYRIAFDLLILVLIILTSWRLCLLRKMIDNLHEMIMLQEYRSQLQAYHKAIIILEAYKGKKDLSEIEKEFIEKSMVNIKEFEEKYKTPPKSGAFKN